MEHIGAYPGVPIGLLLVQGGWLPQHLRVFLEPGRVEGINQPLEAIDFFILPSASVIGAVQQVCCYALLFHCCALSCPRPVPFWA